MGAEKEGQTWVGCWLCRGTHVSPRGMSRGSNSRFSCLSVSNVDHATRGGRGPCFHRSDFRLQQPFILYCTTPLCLQKRSPFVLLGVVYTTIFVCSVMFYVRVSTVRKPLLTYRASINYQYTQKHMAVRLGRGALAHDTFSAFAHTACSCESSSSASTVPNPRLAVYASQHPPSIP